MLPLTPCVPTIENKTGCTSKGWYSNSQNVQTSNTMPYLKKPRRPAYLPERKRRATGDQSFYNKRAWRKTSRLYRQQNPLCEVCTSIGLLEPATLTDHIIGRQFGGADYTPRNLMAMCDSHHNSKSIKERYGLFLDTVETTTGLVPANRLQVVEVLTGNGE